MLQCNRTCWSRSLAGKSRVRFVPIPVSISSVSYHSAYPPIRSQPQGGFAFIIVVAEQRFLRRFSCYDFTSLHTQKCHEIRSFRRFPRCRWVASTYFFGRPMPAHSTVCPHPQAQMPIRARGFQFAFFQCGLPFFKPPLSAAVRCRYGEPLLKKGHRLSTASPEAPAQ